MNPDQPATGFPTMGAILGVDGGLLALQRGPPMTLVVRRKAYASI
jgi:hypothetical protein